MLQSEYEMLVKEVHSHGKDDRLTPQDMDLCFSFLSTAKRLNVPLPTGINSRGDCKLIGFFWKFSGIEISIDFSPMHRNYSEQDFVYLSVLLSFLQTTLG